MTLQLFWFFGGIAIAGALLMICFRNPIASAFCLIVTMLALSAIFFMLNAQFIGAVQILVYAGAVMVLFLFVIMLLNLQEDPEERSAVTTLSAAGGLCVLFVGLLVYLVGSSSSGVAAAVPQPGFGTIQSIAEALFLRLMLPFEITSVLMLVAIVGAVVLAKRKIT